MSKIKIVDLFAGIGGLRSGVIESLKEQGHHPEIVFTSEIKKTAIKVLAANYPNENITGDITQVHTDDIPQHDILLAGFPCQAFSFAGTRLGFNDPTKGTLFFDVARVLKAHSPEYFILENVEGLLHHDPYPEKGTKEFGRTFNTILETLNSLEYNVDWRVLNATDFGVPQARKRVIIVGAKNSTPDLNKLVKNPSKPLSSILEHDLVDDNEKVIAFAQQLQKHYSDSYLLGKVIRDKRGGANNLHSWNFECRGLTTLKERELMEQFLIETRRGHWSSVKKIQRKECTPLTLSDIKTFVKDDSQQCVEEKVENLSRSNYLLREVDPHGGEDTYRIYSGRLSFPLSHILNPERYTQTLVATDADRLGVIDNGNIRRFSEREIKRLFGFPDDFIIPADVSRNHTFDLFGNSVVIPVAKAVTDCLIAK